MGGQRGEKAWNMRNYIHPPLPAAVCTRSSTEREMSPSVPSAPHLQPATHLEYRPYPAERDELPRIRLGVREVLLGKARRRERLVAPKPGKQHVR